MAEAHIYDSLEDLQIGLLADYCFDEAWITHLHSEGFLKEYFPKINEVLEKKSQWDDDYAIAIACAATEIGEIWKDTELPTNNGKPYYYGYASSHNGIQEAAYKQLIAVTDFPDKYCETYMNSPDPMTNFFYVMKIAIALLSPRRLSSNRKYNSHDKIRPSLNFSSIKKRELEKQYCISGLRGDRGELWEGLYDAFKNALTDAREETENHGLIKTLKYQLDVFAQRASQLGNYNGMPNKIGDESNLNPRKGNFDGGLRITRNDLEILINDQFALFLEWVFDHYSDDPKLIDTWLDSMCIRGCAWYYRLATKHYIRAFQAKTPEERIVQFTKYLEYVNEAIKVRSEDIAKVLLENHEKPSTKEVADE